MNLPKNVEEMTEKKNGLYTMHAMSMMTLTPINVRICRPEEIAERCQEYFALCMEGDIKPSFAGFSFALGMSRSKMTETLTGSYAIPDDNLVEIKRFHDILNTLMEEYMMDGKINPVTGIFLLKNNFGYKDQQDVVFNNSVKDKPSEDKLIEEANLLLESTKKANYDD